MSAVVKTCDFRVSYPSVHQSRLNELNGKQEYSVVGLFPPGADLSALKALAEQVAREKWPKKLPANFRSPFRKCEEKEDEDGNLPDGYEKGWTFINFKSNRKPGIVYEDGKTPIEDEADFYPGCWARAGITAYAYDKKGNTGVAFGLRVLQRRKEDAMLGGGVKAEDFFEAVEDAGEVNSGDSMDSMFK